jgi:hypothetical protein
MKNSDTIGKRSRDHQVCSAVPQSLRHRVPLLTYKNHLEMMTEGKVTLKVILNILVCCGLESPGPGYDPVGSILNTARKFRPPHSVQLLHWLSEDQILKN